MIRTRVLLRLRGLDPIAVLAIDGVATVSGIDGRFDALEFVVEPAGSSGCDSRIAIIERRR